jgi:small GTP-binding protein
MGDLERIRLVTLGGTGVGKSSIVKRFLFNTYPDKHKPTVEDLYNQEYDIGSTTLKVDLLDTAGDLQFPAMRRLSITTAHAFLLVYAIDSRESFEQVKSCFEEIREHRADFQEVPIVIAGNKAELPAIKRDVEFDEVCDWIHDHLPKIR